MVSKKTIDEAIKKVFEELSQLSPEEFAKRLEDHKNGDIAQLLDYAWNPEDNETKLITGGYIGIDRETAIRKNWEAIQNMIRPGNPKGKKDK